MLLRRSWAPRSLPLPQSCRPGSAPCCCRGDQHDSSMVEYFLTENLLGEATQLKRWTPAKSFRRQHSTAAQHGCSAAAAAHASECFSVPTPPAGHFNQILQQRSNRRGNVAMQVCRPWDSGTGMQPSTARGFQL